MTGTFGGLNSYYAPQDPLLPRELEYGPSFIDTGACLCSLRLADESDGVGNGDAVNNTDATEAQGNAGEEDNGDATQSDQGDDSDEDDNNSRGKFRIRKRVDNDPPRWQCIGNQTQSVYEVTTGKWFQSVKERPSSDMQQPIYWGGSSPDTSNKTYRWDPNQKSLVVAGDNDFSTYDQACTGVNHTTFSTAFYAAYAEIQADEVPVSAAPCWRPGAVPLQIQNASDWNARGCTNNTVNSLPQYCPPITACEVARLSGSICSLDGKGVSMGPFEPIVCQKGHYCPAEEHGRSTLDCPPGHYCQPGAPTPTPCAVGSYCPAKSARQIYLVPLAIVVVFDMLIVMALIWYTINKRFRNRRESHGQSKPKGNSGFSTTMTGYKELPDDADTDHDHEMMPMDPSYMPHRSETWGFQAMLNMPIPVSSNISSYDVGLSPELRAFVDSMRKATDASQFGLSFSYDDLRFHPKKAPKPILQNVTGSIERGSLTAVMGGSGAGKSTFVNVLMGKTTNTGGTVTVNNVPGKIKRYKKLIGYVPQDDIVLPELTVYENILHSARIRLPRSWKDPEIRAHVASVVDCLELSHVRDSLVGSVGKPVISGGQRKRVSIGMELAAAPMAIFLDEPTSGLDATSASSIMRTLKAIARLGISVIVIIHQPRMEIFEMLDELILLGNGQIIYEGKGRDVQDYFQAMGFHFPEHANVGDVVTDIITGNGRIYKQGGDVSKEALIASWASSHQSASIKLKHASSSISDRASIKRTTIIQRELLKQRGAPRIKQLWLCLRRAVLQQWRTKSTFLFELALASLAGILLGLAQNSKEGILFKGIYNAPYDILSVATDYQSVPQFALLMAIAIGLVSGAPGVKVFSEEMLLYRREAEAGHSRISYFLAKNISVVPRMLFACLHFTTLILVLTAPVMSWGVAFITNLVYFYCIYGLASAVSMVVKREDAPLFATMISLIVGILCGAAPPLSKVKTWHVEWLWRLSPGTWLAEIYFGQNVEPFRYLYDVDLAAALTGFGLHRSLGTNLAVLFAIGTVYRVVAYGGLLAGTQLRV
ncbi:hypothetical protein F5Y17DRAFT_474729 [Xylariaceae sp. FL0594]|nr:hypothetical protein F5Y17DRAFT_474729 [Xylariaceae sp. FL0594]